MSVDFLKKADEQLKTVQQNVNPEQGEQNKEQGKAGWIDSDYINEELKMAAMEILQEKDPKYVQMIEEFKKQYKDVLIYFFDESEFYVYRPLTRFEYKEILASTDDAEKASEMIVMKAVLFPTLTEDKLNTLKAGIVPTLLELILSASNFGVQNPVIKL